MLFSAELYIIHMPLKEMAGRGVIGPLLIMILVCRGGFIMKKTLKIILAVLLPIVAVPLILHTLALYRQKKEEEALFEEE